MIKIVLACFFLPEFFLFNYFSGNSVPHFLENRLKSAVAIGSIIHDKRHSCLMFREIVQICAIGQVSSPVSPGIIGFGIANVDEILKAGYPQLFIVFDYGMKYQHLIQ